MTELAKGLDARTAPNAHKAAKDAKAKEKTAVKASKPAKKTPAKSKAKSPAQRKGDNPKNRSSAVADLCRSLNIEPALGRAKLRRNGLSAPYTDMAKVKAILTGKGE